MMWPESLADVLPLRATELDCGAVDYGLRLCFGAFV
jgi:hypothetical protein